VGAPKQPEPEAPPREVEPKAVEPREEGLGDAAIPAQVFGRTSCPFTHRALRLLERREVEHVYTELAAPGGFQLAPRLKAATGQRTVPYVYLRGRFVGGYDALDEIDRLGQLDEMIKTKEERAASGGSRHTKIRIAPRPKE
jgi:glutaredoxin